MESLSAGRHSATSMEPAVAEFLAEREMVTIVPNFSQRKLYLISGDVGPFVPSIPVLVPLWIAINLRQRQMCRMIPLTWMDVEFLEIKKQEEIDSSLFTEMPSHYMEIMQLMLDVAVDDISRGDEIKTLLKDIWDIRLSKLRSSIDAFLKSSETYAKVNHLTTLEINMVRPFLSSALNHMYALRQGSNSSTESSSQNYRDEY